jgi:hypothetical protein
MNSRVEPKFRDTGDARGKLVGLTSGAGFRLLVKQALAPGEPLQIDIGDGNLLVLARYRLPVEMGHSFGAEGIAEGMNSRRGDAAVSSEEAPLQDAAGLAGRRQIQEDRGPLPTATMRDSSSKQSSARDRRGLALGGIAAAVALSALGILWGGIRGEHTIAPLTAFAAPTKTPIRTIEKTEPTATNSVEAPAVVPGAPRSRGPAAPTALSFPERKSGDAAPKSAAASKAPPIAAIIRAKTIPIVTASVQPARFSKTAVISGTGAANRISIKASDTSWVTACADGVRVFGKVFNKGESGEVRFSSRAAVHSANAGAIELSIGEQAIGLMGKWGQVRTMNATPAGYEFAATTPAGNCSETSPEN